MLIPFYSHCCVSHLFGGCIDRLCGNWRMSGTVVNPFYLMDINDNKKTTPTHSTTHPIRPHIAPSAHTTTTANKETDDPLRTVPPVVLALVAQALIVLPVGLKIGNNGEVVIEELPIGTVMQRKVAMPNTWW